MTNASEGHTAGFLSRAESRRHSKLIGGAAAGKESEKVVWQADSVQAEKAEDRMESKEGDWKSGLYWIY